MEITVERTNRVTGAVNYAKSTEGGDTLVALRGAKYEEVTRSGYAFHVITTTATASLIAVGTTTCAIGLCNTADDGGRSMIIDSVFAIKVTQAAALSQESLFCVVGQTRVAALAGGLVVRRNNGLGVTTDSVALATAGGNILDAVTGVAIGWIPVPGCKPVYGMVNSLPGQCLWANVQGRLIVPPGRQFGVSVVSSEAVTGTWNVGVAWHEKQLKLY